MSHIGRGTTVTNNQVKKEKSDNFVWQELLSGQAESLINPYNTAMAELLYQKDLIAMDSGIADPAHYPKEAFAKLSQDILINEGEVILQHNSPQGLLSLRESLVSIMKLRGIHTQVENIVVLNGSQQGLDLISRILLEPGDIVFVEEPSFLGAIDIFRAYGVKIVGIPTDSDGIIIERLEKAVKRTRPKIIYTIPTYQNPSGTSLSTIRRKELIEIANKYQVPILEDDPYGLIYFNKPIPALKSLDTTESIIYLSTFSKVLANGLRLGWLVVPNELSRIVTAAKQINDLHSSNLIQRMVDLFIREGLYEQHLGQIREIYKNKRDTMHKALSKYAPEDMTWNIPDGGYYIWATLPPGLSAIRVLEEAVENKVSFVAGPVFYSSDNGSDKIRLNYSFSSADDITKGIKILSSVISNMKKQVVKQKTVLGREHIPIV